MYVHFHTFKDFGTSQVYQVTKDDENLKCWKVSLAELEVCQQVRWYISAMQAMSDDGEKIEIDLHSMCLKQIGATWQLKWGKWRNINEEKKSPNIPKFNICCDLDILQC